MKRHLYWLLLLIVTVSLAVFVVLLSLMIGEVNISLSDIFNSSDNSLEQMVVFQIRLPRAIMAVVVGGMLSLSGGIMQGLFRNPLVEPYTMGLSSGAALAVSIAFVTGMVAQFGQSAINIAALCGGLGIMVILLSFKHLRNADVGTMLLMGVMIGLIASSITTLTFCLMSRDSIAQIIFWTMGSLSSTDYTMVTMLCITALCGLMLSILFSQILNAISQGEDSAQHLGVDTRLFIPVLFSLAAIMTSMSVAASGIIGFVGLVVPHIVRSLVSNDYRFILPISFFLGGTLLGFCDLLSRMIISPAELPIGVITGIIGGCTFLWILIQEKRRTKNA